MFCHFSLLTFLLYISSVLLGSVLTLFIDMTAVPSLIARVGLATLLCKAGSTFFLCKPTSRPSKLCPSWRRLVLYLRMSYVVGYMCCFLWVCCCFIYNLSSPEARPLVFNKYKTFIWNWFDYLLLCSKPPQNSEVYNINLLLSLMYCIFGVLC